MGLAANDNGVMGSFLDVLVSEYIHNYSICHVPFKSHVFSPQQKRYQILDTTAQRQKAYLGYGKGLQSRRLPSHLASKVGDDYYEKRKSYDPKILLDSATNPVDQRERKRTRSDITVEPSPLVNQTKSPEEREREVRILLSILLFG